MKEFAIQKQLVPVDNGTDPNWAKRQIWVKKMII